MGRIKKNLKSHTSKDSNTEFNTNYHPNEQVKLDLDIQNDKYDSCNSLLLMAKGKRKNCEKMTKKGNLRPKKRLSKKQKRNLEKVLERKRKKINRSVLLEKLQKVQATTDELEQITSTSSMQTFGLRKVPFVTSFEKLTSSVNLIKKNKRRKVTHCDINEKGDSNTVGFHESSSESDDIELIDKNDKKFSETKSNSSMHPLENTAKAITSTCSLMIKDTAVARSTILKKQLLSTTSCQPAVFIPVHRLPEIQAARESLPIYSEEQTIMEAIKENSVIIIHGATGSGKTTQVPQFLYEAGYTKNNMIIGVTEPRRIAAVQMASRVGEEMNLPNIVSYQIRYEKTVTADSTEIKFMTDGILLKEIQNDFLLLKYSVIIIDEAHERSVFSDVLIGLLSRILLLREKKQKPLKLIIMSATLRVDDFTKDLLFKQKPYLITINSRQYDVVLHFNTKTPIDYVRAAYEKVCKIHSQLPSGAILVFLTGEKEVTRLCKLLQKTFPFEGRANANKTKNMVNRLPELISKKNKKQNKKILDSFSEFIEIDLDNYSVEPLDNEGIQHQESDDDDDEKIQDKEFFGISPNTNFEPLYVLPLYSVLPTEEQAKVFKPSPNNSRLCVVSTNVAETSITIPGLKYVVDSGKVKTRVYDKYSGGISKFSITWTSKASANQRAGRAGRTEGGHCYRLYSSAVFEHDFPEFMLPDIQRIPVDDIVLQLKALGIDRVVNFPFPSSPDMDALKGAEKRLVMLGALADLKKGQRFQDISKWEYSAKITPLGKAMSRFPISPRYAKMLLLSYKHQVIPHTIAIVSAMTVSEVFLNSNPSNNTDTPDNYNVQNIGILKIGAGMGKSFKLGDAMVLLRAVTMFENSKHQIQFCSRYHIRHKAMVEIRKMRLHLIKELNRSFYGLNISTNLKLELPTDDQVEILRKILISGLIDHIAKKIPVDVQKSKENCNIAYQSLELDELVFIHPSSILSKELPEYIAYQDIFQTSKYFMRNILTVEPEWLTALATNQCEFSTPLEVPQPCYDANKDQILCNMTATFGRWNWELPCVVMPMPTSLVKYNYFCYFLLDGQICSYFNKYKKYLLSPASVMLKQWARLLPRTRLILQAVMDKEVDTKEALIKTWKDNPNYLLREYCNWLPEEKHTELMCKWPPM